jgi:hypothetical protein
VITRKSQFLINFFNIRVIVDGKDIYNLVPDKPAIISVPKKHAQLVVTDGFHITKPLELLYHRPHTYYLKVVCAIDNNLLITGVVLLVLFSVVGVLSNVFILRVLSVLPILYFLLLYYVKRKEFIRIKVG